MLEGANYTLNPYAAIVGRAREGLVDLVSQAKLGADGSVVALHQSWRRLEPAEATLVVGDLRRLPKDWLDKHPRDNVNKLARRARVASCAEGVAAASDRPGRFHGNAPQDLRDPAVRHAGADDQEVKMLVASLAATRRAWRQDEEKTS